MTPKCEPQPPFETPRAAALALLAASERWPRKAAGFLGHMAVAQQPLTARQQAWLEDLLEQAGFPRLLQVSER
jgi:hypothetical protein